MLPIFSGMASENYFIMRKGKCNDGGIEFLHIMANIKIHEEFANFFAVTVPNIIMPTNT